MIFLHNSDFQPYIENRQADDFNDLADASKRRGNPFWSFLRDTLSLPPERFPFDNEGVSPEIAAIRRYQAEMDRLQAPPAPPTLSELAGEAATHVAEAVKAGRTKTEMAREWLAARLQHGPVDAAVLESEARDAGFTWKMIKQVKARLRVASVRKGAKHWRWRLPMAGEAKGDNA